MEENISSDFRSYIGLTDPGDLSLEEVLKIINEKGAPENFETVLGDLRRNRIFVLKHGAPEMYYKNNLGQKNGWLHLQNESDLLEAEYLKEMLTDILS